MAPKSPFKHTPLDLDRPAFRLLRLKAASNASTRKRKRSVPIEEILPIESAPVIECELIEAFNDDDFVPDYEAVSYT